MQEKWVGALNASLRNSRSSRQIRARHGMSRRAIPAGLCFNTIDLEQCAEQTRKRETGESGSKAIRASLCKQGDRLKAR